MPHNSHFHRQYLILNIINHLGPISRTELTNLTDYRPATVTDIIKELLDADLIAETGNLSVGHGRNRTLLEMNKTHLCAIGISFFSKSVIKATKKFFSFKFAKKYIINKIRSIHIHNTFKII